MSGEVELVLDLRGLRNAPTTPDGFAELWDAVEPALVGRDLAQRQVHELHGPDGSVRLEVARLPHGTGVVDHDTRFAIVAVREQPYLRYRCKHCEASGETGYAPFVCASCPRDDAGGRVCDRHVVILDGALLATCPDHHPPCQECGAPAVFRCAGRSCRRERAWCAAHRRPHPRDPDVDYCPSCYDDVFPRCEAPGCTDIGTVRCEHVSRDLHRCGQRMCTRHARRWQVFGGERVGLGRCGRHGSMRGVAPDELVFQIVVGASARKRKERLPSLQGFAHNLRNSGHRDLALDYERIHRLLDVVGREVSRDRAAAAAISETRPVWARQLAGLASTSQEGRRLVDRLKSLIVAHDRRFGVEVAAAIELAEYKPPIQRDGVVTRRATLFVKVPDHLRGRFIGPRGQNVQAYGAGLGVDVKIEGGRRP
ncbi:KH domain-containing protein [Goodfellowiella coeruleoviolacea]|uniref:K Homology domain-containing protein n=1 Tax=Goodfellowiella coeruleoviolacea TaxID=334858 RepID=A0AAE3GFS7_9PSEU|nr:hypothetical protein [Goodfellowiella coeruleoviolacea]MCP2167447.1 hypothetical protein [Goodfellowiella coeruleoviolacea]